MLYVNTNGAVISEFLLRSSFFEKWPILIVGPLLHLHLRTGPVNNRSVSSRKVEDFSSHSFLKPLSTKDLENCTILKNLNRYDMRPRKGVFKYFNYGYKSLPWNL